MNITNDNDLAWRTLAIVQCWRKLAGVKETKEVLKGCRFRIFSHNRPNPNSFGVDGVVSSHCRHQPGEGIRDRYRSRRHSLSSLQVRYSSRHGDQRGTYPMAISGGATVRLRSPLYKRFAGPGQSLHLIRADSHHTDTLRRVRKILQEEPLDYLFIDRDHTYQGVKRDFQMYSPLVKKGGIAAFHDIAPHPAGLGGGVPQFWGEIKDQYSSRELIADPTGGYGIGVLRA